METPTPRLFISYRWSSPAHEQWVLILATELRAAGIDVILDKWNLREGQDTSSFMETTVSDETISKVLLVCDQGYVERADSRTGGVGIESQIISKAVYDKTDQTKYAAAALQLDGSGRPLLPIFLASRIYFDFTAGVRYANSFQQVVRWCYGKPFYTVPPLGTPPKFLDETFQPPTLVNIPTARFNSAINRGDADSANAAKSLLRDAAAASRSLALSLHSNDLADQVVYDTIYAIMPTIDECLQAAEVLLAVGDQASIDEVHSFFEQIVQLWDYRVESPYSSFDNDVLRFFGHYCFVGVIAICMKRRYFSQADKLLGTPFFVSRPGSVTGSPQYYDCLRPYLSSIEERRKSRLGLNRISVHADIISDSFNRIKTISFADFMEADFTLYLRSLIASSFGGVVVDWYPISLLYAASASGAFPSYARGLSMTFYSRLKTVLYNSPPDGLRSALIPYQSGTEKFVRYNYNTLPVFTLGNIKGLGTTS